MKEARAVTLTITDEVLDSDTKRFYVPATIKCRCPECGQEMTWDGNSDYLSYPQFNAATMIYFECAQEHESFVPVKLSLTLELR